MSRPTIPIIGSMLDTDLYKLTMSAAYLFGSQNGIHYSECDGTYEFINRGKTKFPSGFDSALQDEVNAMGELHLFEDEAWFLERSCPYLRKAYIDFLRNFRFNPDQVVIKQVDGDLTIKIHGPLYQSTLWEVPLMALICELYYRMTNQQPDDQALSRMQHKGRRLADNNIMFTDFGTRRRFSYDIHDTLVSTMQMACVGKECIFRGTSNVHMAQKYGLPVQGTQGHEYIMFHAALFGFSQANPSALRSWANEYRGSLGIALTDTFTSKVFFQQFDASWAKLYDGLRQDSGDPIEFAKQAVNHYLRLGINPATKTLVFSDSLTVDKAIEIQKWCRENGRGIHVVVFGIGTHFTCDVGVEPLNIVIKLTECNGNPTVKLSDSPGKSLGVPEVVARCKAELNIQ